MFSLTQGDATFGQTDVGFDQVFFRGHPPGHQVRLTGVVALPEFHRRGGLTVGRLGRAKMGRSNRDQGISRLHMIAGLLMQGGHHSRHLGRKPGVTIAVVGNFSIALDGLRNLSILRHRCHEACILGDFRAVQTNHQFGSGATQ